MNERIQELDTVEVIHLSSELADHQIWDGSIRPPQVGDLGTVIDLHGNGSQHTEYRVENVDSAGRTLWMATFRATELNMRSRPC